MLMIKADYCPLNIKTDGEGWTKDGHAMERNAMTEIIYVRRDKR